VGERVRSLRVLAAGFLGLALIAGCGSSRSAESHRGSTGSDAAVKRDVLRGISLIRSSHDKEKLRGQLVRTIRKLRTDEPATAKGRKAQRLAIKGFGATLEGVNSQIAFAENDSGNIEAATRDALRADRYLTGGAKLLRAAGAALEVRVAGLREP
jgi:hypothetical protein